MSEKIQGYEFLVDIGEHSEWMQLQGSGGTLGDGCLFDGCDSGRVTTNRLLKRAQKTLRRDGVLLKKTGVYFGGDAFETIEADAVLACRPVSLATSVEEKE